MANRNEILAAFATVAKAALVATRSDTTADVAVPPDGVPQNWRIFVFFHSDSYTWIDATTQAHEMKVVVSLVHVDDPSGTALGATELLRASAAFDLVSDAIWRKSNPGMTGDLATAGVTNVDQDAELAGIQVDGLNEKDRRCTIGEVYRVWYRRTVAAS